MQRTPEEIKEFCLSNIAPYFKDPSTCGINGRTCSYLTKDGKMCVLGKNLLIPKGYSGVAEQVLSIGKQEDILKPEAVGMLNSEQWNYLQAVHDSIALDHGKEAITNNCNRLGIFTYDEMVEYAGKLL